MSKRKNLSIKEKNLILQEGDKEAWRVVGRLEGGQTQAEVAQAIGVSQSMISRIWNRFLETESAGRRPGQGRRRATTPNEDRFLVLTARRHRNMNATLLQQHLRSATGTTVSTQTVRNRLHGVGLYARRPLLRLSTMYQSAKKVSQPQDPPAQMVAPCEIVLQLKRRDISVIFSVYPKTDEFPAHNRPTPVIRSKFMSLGALFQFANQKHFTTPSEEISLVGDHCPPHFLRPKEKEREREAQFFS
ncbi:transposable element Tcb2 transposase [Trichonephila clavipes]|nr:transposable element Tcb2 transposase [Trichonephila clavipes]